MSSPSPTLSSYDFLTCLYPRDPREKEAVMAYLHTLFMQCQDVYGIPFPHEMQTLLFKDLVRLQELTWYQYVLFFLVFFDASVYTTCVAPLLKTNQIKMEDLGYMYYELKLFMCCSFSLEFTDWSSEEDGGWITKEHYRALQDRLPLEEQVKTAPKNPRLLVWRILQHFMPS